MVAMASLVVFLPTTWENSAEFLDSGFTDMCRVSQWRGAISLPVLEYILKPLRVDESILGLKFCLEPGVRSFQLSLPVYKMWMIY